MNDSSLSEKQNQELEKSLSDFEQGEFSLLGEILVEYEEMKNIIISSTAQKHLQDIIFHLDKQWTMRSKEQFLSKLFSKIEEVNRSCKIDDIKQKKMSFVVFRQITLYCIVTESEIKILSFFDAKRRPKRIPKTLQ